MRLSAADERLRNSLFLVPMLYVVGSVLLGLAGVRLDRELVENGEDLPFNLTSTVESARAVLSTVAGATITVAGIAFSVSLLIIQLASSQYSPRVVTGLFRDPFNKRVMGIVVGTFTYCLVVLRAVRSPLEEGGDAVVPNISVAFAVVAGLLSIMAIVAFISHNAHTMDVSKILHDVTEQALEQVRDAWPLPELQDDGADLPDGPTTVDPPVDVLVIPFDDHGWVQRIDGDELVRAGDPGSTVRLETTVGRYAVAGTPLCSIWPRPSHEDEACRIARRALVVGETRTSPEDVGYGIRQLADVALKALSPGINDPTTAQDAMFHAATVLRELLRRQPPRARQPMADGRILVLGEEPSHGELIDTAFDEVRLASTGMPTVSIYLLEIIALLIEAVADDDRADGGRAALRRQAQLIRAGVEATDLLPEDKQRVIRAWDERFGGVSPIR